jgi:hypothetical protein
MVACTSLEINLFVVLRAAQLTTKVAVTRVKIVLVNKDFIK